MRIRVLVALTILICGSAAEASNNVLLVNPEDSLLRATEQALRPWEIAITALSSEEIVPSESMPGARDRARELCRNHQARAAVWITSNANGEALWIYDQQTDRVVVRKLHVRVPLGDADAAAIALSIKTLLMHTTAAPPDRRFGASASAAAQANPKLPPAAARWQMHSELLVRRGLVDGHSDARIGFGLFRDIQPLQLGIVLASGPGHSVDSLAFQGHFVGASLALEARIRRPWRHFTWLGLAQVSLHRAHLSGTLSPEGISVAKTRFNPSVALGVALEVPLSVARLGLGLRTRYYTRSQRYLVRNTAVLDLPTTDLELGIFLSVPL